MSVCLGCDGLFDSARPHSLTCSGACRVRVHRHPEAVEAKEKIADFMGVTVSLMQRAEAVTRLRPDLAEKIHAGELDLDAVQDDLVRAYWDIVWKAAA